MKTKKFDIAIIGGGPGGYVCAIRAAQLGLNTALVEKNTNLGGTCLNVGCIPSKALLHSTEMFAFCKNESSKHGILHENLSIDLTSLMKRKEKVVQNLRHGVATLVSKRKIQVVTGTAMIEKPGFISVKAESENSQKVEAKNIVIATGSQPVELPFLPFDQKSVCSSDQAIAWDTIPSKLVVIGAGAIGLELGSVWNRLGSEVTVIEFLPQIAPTFDLDIARIAQRIFKKQGLILHTDTQVTGIQKNDERLLLKADKKGKTIEFEAEKVLVSVGRKPFNSGLGLEDLGVKRDERGFILVDKHYKTGIPGIFAIGDTIPGPMLAHKAEEEGIAVAEIIAGKAGHVNYQTIPNVIYTDPEIAAVGLTEREAKDQGLTVKIGKFPFSANGRGLASGHTDGQVKVIADSKTDALVGIQIIASHASELIAEAVTHMEYGGSAEDMARTVHAHPTLSEALKEAAMGIDHSAIHSL